MEDLNDDDNDSMKTSEPAGSSAYKKREDQAASLQAEAVFLYLLGSLALVGLILAPARIAFSRQASDPRSIGVVEVILYASDLGFLVLYLTGVRVVRRAARRRQRALALALGEAQEQPLRPFQLGHPFQLALQAGIATLLPLFCDVLGDVLILTSGDSPMAQLPRVHALHYAGLLRVFHVLKKPALFDALKCNMLVSHYFTFVIGQMITIVMCAHYAGCLLWFIARVRDFSEAESWVGAHRPELVDASPTKQWLVSMYWATVTSSTVGYGDFFPVSDLETIIITVFILANVIIVANIVGGISAIASQADVDMAANRQRLDDLNRFIDKHPISADVAAAAREYLVQSMHAAADSIAATDCLPPSIRERIREERFSDVLSSCSLFRGVSRLLIQQIIARVTEDVFVAGVDVVRTGSVSGRLYLILEGFAQVVVRGVKMSESSTVGSESSAMASDGSLVVATLQPGASFGAEGWACAINQPWTCRAKTLLKVASLSEVDRRELEDDFPHDW